MKRKTSKIQQNALVIIASVAIVALMCAFTMVDKEPSNSQKAEKPMVSLAHLNPQPDSVMVAILGEEVADIVFGAKKAVLSHLNPMETPADGDPTIGGVKVATTLGSLNKTDLITIQFLMADSAFYNDGSVIVTAPYAPNYALSFAKGKKKVDLVFSLGSFQIGIVVDGRLTKVVRYNNARIVTRFFRLVSQNDFYDKVIENL